MPARRRSGKGHRTERRAACNGGATDPDVSHPGVPGQQARSGSGATEPDVVVADRAAADVAAVRGDAAARQTFRSPLALPLWWLWCAFAVANFVDLGVQGHGHDSVLAAAALILVTGIAYVTLLQPRVAADQDGITVRNVLRDHRVPWAAVRRVDIRDLLRVHCAWRDPSSSTTAGGPRRQRVISAWGVQSSRRSQAPPRRRLDPVGSMRPDRSGSPGRDSITGTTGTAGMAGTAGSEPIRAYHRREAERIARTLDERARAARAGADCGPAGAGPAGAERAPVGAAATAPVSTWCWPSLAALIVPALLLVVVILV